MSFASTYCFRNLGMSGFFILPEERLFSWSFLLDKMPVPAPPSILLKTPIMNSVLTQFL